MAPDGSGCPQPSAVHSSGSAIGLAMDSSPSGSSEAAARGLCSSRDGPGCESSGCRGAAARGLCSPHGGSGCGNPPASKYSPIARSHIQSCRRSSSVSFFSWPLIESTSWRCTRPGSPSCQEVPAAKTGPTNRCMSANADSAHNHHNIWRSGHHVLDAKTS